MEEVAAMTRYLQFFAFFGVPFSLLFALPYSPSSHPSFLNNVVEGLLFVAFMAVVDAWITRRARRRLEAKGITVSRMNPRQEQFLHISTSSGVAFQSCVRVVRKMPGIKIVAIDSREGSVTADTCMSWRSFGERMVVQVRPVGGGSRIRVTSVPIWPIALLDGGKGAENVGMVLRELSAPTAAELGR
jgi:hypothetical protein